MINPVAQKQIDIITERCQVSKPLVAIQCITYNQERYIKDALEGFVNQQTNFPFVAIVHDDASTDNTAKIIKEYAENYPNIIFPIFEKENQYSKNDGSITEIRNEASASTGAKYVALCEGDDYWIDPLKLQKQVDFLENHPDYTLCATNYLIKSKTSLTYPDFWFKNNYTPSIEEVIFNGGGYMATASLMYRQEIFREYPETLKGHYAGDYPLQMFMAHKGKVVFLFDITTVYRSFSEGSWSQRTFNEDFSFQKKKEYLEKHDNLLLAFNNYTQNQYSDIIRKKIAFFKVNTLTSYPKEIRKDIIKNLPVIINTKGVKFVIYQFIPDKIKNLIRKIKK